jgi:pimeloyl-ACP methyl ester carboxylesterase
MHFVYLHGFASSPKSKKAAIFAAKFAEIGQTLHVPDLNVPDFAHLTLTAMVERVAETVRALPPGPVTVMGSSMGGLTALAFADLRRDAEAESVERLVLLAPALDFMENRTRALGEDGLRRWQETGWLETFNYASGKPERVHYGLVGDVMQYDSFAFDRVLPILIYHGAYDASVDYRQSIRFAEDRSYVDLHVVDSDHELLDQTETIWDGIQSGQQP